MTAPTSVLATYGISVGRVLRNATPAILVEEALQREKGSALTSTGALVALSGRKTGRVPNDKRVVDEPSSSADIWWGSVNIKLPPESFLSNRAMAVAYLNTRDTLYCVDAFAGWDPNYRLKIRVICARAYHALFMHNMLIRPTAAELETFGEPDYVIFNAGQLHANPHVPGVAGDASVALDFGRKEMVILGTEYAGEMKKGVFTIMNYLMPKQGVLSMHCSATDAKDGSGASILFGLSGTGKTTLSADPKRVLIGDDEHAWTSEGVFNVEGGCYAKMINLSAEAEPDIFQAIRFGAVLENVIMDAGTRTPDYNNISITENTRGSYPIEYIQGARIPCVSGHPKNVIFLTCDAFGVLPPVSKLTPEQVMYHFISGYTAKVAGTEVGVTEPKETFSPCFGGPFMVWHPGKYAELLAAKVAAQGASCWLVNTGWSGGKYGVGKRMKLSVTRAIIDAIHSGELAQVTTLVDPVFGLAVPTACPGVSAELLDPRGTWADKAAYDDMARRLARLFTDNFKRFESGVSDAVRAAGPKL